ncbi:MAG: hypothetical protein LBN39_05685 [Planctomycetaceae bacterium]|nr:hypothetical protein [Planctomycetaceae bacterium]
MFLLLAGLSFLALRRRGEILRQYLMPAEDNLTQEFFRRIPKPPKEPAAAAAETETTQTAVPETAQWGTGTPAA